MRPLSILLLVGALALLAGCVDLRDKGTPGPGDGSGNETSNTTTSIPMDFQAAGPGPFAPGGGSFDVPANASMVIFEARWTCTSPTCTIAISVLDANGTEVASGSGDRQADLEVTEPAPGTYTVQFSAQAPVAGVSGEARVTVFTADVPDGFTAWEGETSAREARR